MPRRNLGLGDMAVLFAEADVVAVAVNRREQVEGGDIAEALLGADEDLAREHGAGGAVGEGVVGEPGGVQVVEDAVDNLALGEDLVAVAQVARLVRGVLPAVGEDQDLLLVDALRLVAVELREEALRQDGDGGRRAAAHRSDDLGVPAAALGEADGAAGALEEGGEDAGGTPECAALVLAHGQCLAGREGAGEETGGADGVRA